jgi:hypothetical protein
MKLKWNYWIKSEIKAKNEVKYKKIGKIKAEATGVGV